ncbi:PAAR domain-containing protein [Pseudomonas indica]|uniref:Type VI secretion system secreted protein VgrG n=1 Tax=Pseudomonas indica TaxID=137658 RepID=A0A1G8TBS6_9PSED|nr:PAAR domain-containing protein [Pseudomonas indica]SDJ39026.1 type VI secretion system secreted protein VgrG [Pseudomonas indica]
MSGKPAARQGDAVTCPACGKAIVASGSSDVTFEHQPAARAGDTCICGAPLTQNMSSTVLINGRPALFMGSSAENRGVIISGAGTVVIGDQVVPADFEPPSPMPGVPLARPATPATPSAWREEPGDPAPLGLEEEDEEEELEEPAQQAVTLRIGVFFDGTGNNLGNSALVAGCFARDVDLEHAADGIRAFCARYGFDGKGSSPDNSYGNDKSNVARLYELYRDDSQRTLDREEPQATLKVYVEGIGTSSGQSDSLYGQATGLGATGVVARVEQSPALIVRQLLIFQRLNPDTLVNRIEFDVFGFSRGAAAARHFANDVLKGDKSLVAQALPTGSPGLSDGFAWRPGVDVALNFIGLFDTVAGIVSLRDGDFGAHNAANPGVNLRLTPDMARKIVHLVARDEVRHNFALNSAGTADIRLPGVHSDVGGGYLPRAQERVLLTKPRSLTVSRDIPPERSHPYRATQLESQNHHWFLLESRGLPLTVVPWETELPYLPKRDPFPEKRVYAALISNRVVLGDLALVYLRIMRELGVRNGVPFDLIDDYDRQLALPEELQPIAAKLMAYALGQSPSPGLTEREEALLYTRYIHQSAHWNAAVGRNGSDLDTVFVNRPADNHQRVIYPNE